MSTHPTHSGGQGIAAPDDAAAAAGVAAVQTKPPGPNDYVPPPLDMTSPQLTIRAVLTSMILGGVLSMCNIYTGLTIGWGLNVSVTAILITFAFWQMCEAVLGTRKWGILENNIAQTGCSSAAAVSSAGLVAPIPALAMLTGQTLEWPQLALWVFSVCLVGITIGVPLRKQMIVTERLPFPGGFAAGTMLKEMYAHGSEAVSRVIAMLNAAVIAAVIKLFNQYPWMLQKPLDTKFKFDKWDFLPAMSGFSAKSLTFYFDPTLLMMGVGGLIGIRGCTSLIIGAVLAWLVIAPPLIHSGHVRLKVNEALPQLPAGVAERLKPQPEGFAKYRSEAGVLEFAGQMGVTERDGLVALSDDTRWRSVIEKLYWRSQLERAVPLSTPPAAAELPKGVRYDAQRKLLLATAPLDRDARQQLGSLSGGAESAAAAKALAQIFTHATTRDFITTTPLDALPRDFVMPAELRYVVRFDARAKQLVVTGVLDDTTLAKLLGKVRAFAASHAGEAARCDALVAALQKLHDQTAMPLPETALAVPDGLRDVVTIDAVRRQVRAVGILSAKDEAALLESHKGDADFATTIKSLVAGSQFVAAAPNQADVVGWLLWPGVTLMVVSSLVSFAFSWKSIARSFTGFQSGGAAESRQPGELTTGWFAAAAAVAFVLAVYLQVSLFGIPMWAASVGVVMSLVLALVAARVSGETNTTPVGAMGKVTQLAFGVLVPQSAASNLMAANVTGGAASQCADLLHDLKSGHMLGASPSKQFVAQVVGALAGSMVGSFAYLIMIPHPADQLMTEQWAAPAVATWKAVAELFMVGFKAIPAGSGVAMAIAATLGVILPILDKTVPGRWKLLVPSSASLGLAFVIPGANSLSMFLGALIAWLLSKAIPNWTTRFLVSICAGIVAGESLTGVGIAFEQIISTM